MSSAACWLTPVMLVVATVSFILIRLAPGDPASVIAGPYATGDNIARLQRSLGLDQPLPIQLVKWWGRLARGDLGDSIFLRRPVLLIKHRDEQVDRDYDVTAEEMTSVTTGRTMEEIASENDRVWNSNRDDDEAPKPARKKRAKKSAVKKAASRKTRVDR